MSDRVHSSTRWVSIILLAQWAITSAFQAAMGADPIEMLTLTVTDSLNGEHVAGANVQLIAAGARPHVLQSWTTGSTANQRLQFATPMENQFQLWTVADGYVPLETIVERDISGAFPENCTVLLTRSATVAGTVLDERGKPLGGVEVHLEIRTQDAINGSIRPDTHNSFHYEKTDDNGRWTCRHAPKQLRNVCFQFIHPEFVTAEIATEASDRARTTEIVPAADLLAFRGSIFMKRGLTLNGSVMDSNQKPVEGAEVIGPDFPVWTPADGHFSFHNCPTGAIFLTAYAKGFAPQRKHFLVTETNSEAPFQLDRGNVLRLRVQDLKGRPVPQARVAAESWQGRLTSPWQWETDQQGRVVWESAPADEVLYAINHVGYESLRAQSLKADGQEHTVTLLKHLQISGKVVDADTSAPVPEFRIIRGQLHITHYDWNATNILDAKKGTYLITLPKQTAPHLLQVQANGYYPEISRTFKDDEEDGVADFRLKRGEPLSGKVQLPDGKPAAKAQVALCTPDNEVVIGENGLLDSDLGCTAETDQLGEFVFQPRRDIRWIAAANEQGYAEVSIDDFKRSPTLILKPWGQINGSLRSGSFPGTNQLIKLARLGSLSPQLHPNRFTRLTGGAGSFTFERVPPGQLIISRVINMQFSHAQIIDIPSARSADLSLGNGGRTVTGKIESADGQALDWEAGNHPAFLHVTAPPLSVPKLADSVAMNRWVREFWDSSEGRARQVSNVSYVFEFRSNNVFHVDNVPAGDYECEIHYHQPASVAAQPDVCMGILKQPVTIPPGEPDIPVDLGTVKITLKKTP